MKVLLVHNYYRSSSPSGENVVFELERDLLVRNGHEVRSFVRHSDELQGRGWMGVLLGAAATPWNPWMARKIREVVEEFRPDVVHAHNTFPLISPAIFPAVGRRAARVLTLHNYRIFCPAAVPLRGGRTCTDCLDQRSVLPALRHGCYRASRVATVPLAVNVALSRARSLWQRHVDAFIALTEFQRELMVAAGLPAGRVFVKPNFYPGRPEVVPWSRRRPCVVYVGRLSEEKGVRHLLDAWSAWGADAPPLRVIGDGPLRVALERQATAGGMGGVSFLGPLEPRAAEAEISTASLLVLPSICFEGFPLVLREAFAFGTPAAVSDLGALPSLVEQGRAGVIFRPGDAASLLERVRSAWTSPGVLESKGLAARRAFEEKYGEAENHRVLMRLYESAIASQRARGGPWAAASREQVQP